MTIKHSENLDQLFGALSKLQGKIENAKKDKPGFNNNYKYAKLEQYIELSKELLAEHGLCIMQIPGSMEIVEVTKEAFNKENKTYFFQQIMMPKQKLVTWIGHDSGQFIHGEMELLVEKMVANSWGQSSGVSVSFMRRYALAGLLGMTQEDDDNQLAKSDVEKNYSQSRSLPPVQKSLPPVAYEKINQDQVKELTSLLMDDIPRLDRILVWANVQFLEDLSTSHYETVIGQLKKEGKVPQGVIKDKNLIDPKQVSFISSLLTPERLNKILEKYKLTKLEEMTLEDYNTEYYILRQEITPPNGATNIKQAL